MKALLTLVFTLTAVDAWAQGSSNELTCRNKAKEVAAQSYSSCITEARNTQIDEIRKNYQKDLTDLKNKYEQELKSLGAAAQIASDAKKATPRSAVKSAKATKSAKAPKRSSGQKKSLARSLPSKTTPYQEALPIQNSTINENQVIAVEDTAPEPLEREAASADQMEIVEMPSIEE